MDPLETKSDLPTLASADALEVVQGYALVRLISNAPGARVYECRHERTGLLVHLTILPPAPGNASEDARKTRALRDNRLLAGLRNGPHGKFIVPIVDVGEGKAGAYVAQEKLAGTFVGERVVTGRIAVAEALPIVRDVARALEAAHTIGVVHRDVCPARIVQLPDGSARLGGFGTASFMSAEGGAPAELVGTAEITAPELARGASADVRSDIYALGATLFWLITGRPLFTGSAAEVLAAQQKKPVPSIASMVPNAGIAVVDILYRLLQKEPSRRPAAVADVTALLEQAIARMARDSVPVMQAAAPAQESQWPVTVWSSGAVVPLSGGNAPAGHAAALGRAEVPLTSPGPSPFDTPSSQAEMSNPYQGAPTGVMGSLKQMSVVEIIQTLEIGKKSARVEVSAMDGEKGVLHVHDGQIVHCSTSATDGERAAVILCRKKEGYFRIHYEKEQCTKNVQRPTQFVLLEAMRTIDEEAAGAGAAPPSPPRAERDSSERRAHAVTEADVPTLSGKTGPRAPHLPKRDLPSLAKPRIPTGEGAAIARDFDDGIERDDATLPAHARSIDTLSDPTVPELPTRPRATSAGIRAQLGPALQRAIDGTTEVGVHVGTKLEALAAPHRARLARVHPRLASIPAWQLASAAGALAMSFVIVVTSALMSSGPPDADDAIEDVLAGEAGAVIASLSAIPSRERTPGQELALGHAYLSAGNDEEGLALYLEALTFGRVDAHALLALSDRLEFEHADDALDVLILWPDDAEVEDELVSRAAAGSFFARENAVAALVERGALGRIDVEALARLDVIEAPTCPQRRLALIALRMSGKSEPSRAAVERAGSEERNGCFRGELAAATGAIQRRLE